MVELRKVRHGGNVYKASRELGCDPTELIDFSASINPLGPSPQVWKAINRARKLLPHYPDPECWDLRHALAQHWNIDPKQIVMGNGSTELIEIIPRALQISRLLVVQPTFAGYSAAMARAGGSVVSLTAPPENQYCVPLEHLCHLVENRRYQSRTFNGMVLCNPNSPTGQAYTADDVVRLARVANRRGVWLIIDEAFVDYCPERSVLPSVGSWPRVVVLRSMTKFYGLPGLRVGYAVAGLSVSHRLQSLLPPWSVNVLGQVAAAAALTDRDHAEKSLRFIKKERMYVVKRLAALSGCTVMPTEANYVFLELPRGWRAGQVTERLRKEGLLVRDCSSVPGATARSIRLAVRSRGENDHLIQSLSQLLGGDVA